MRKDILIIILILVAAIAGSFLLTPYREHSEMKLVAVERSAVSGNDSVDMRGSIADLYLDIVPGKGRIFIDTYPLTELDTQISTRLAKEIACNFLKEDCSKYDFFYTIKSDSTLIGGPSAGAAIAILTVSALDKTKMKNIAVTGTINSGGIVGVVGGIKEKTEAAKENGLDMIMIPRHESRIIIKNSTLNPYGNNNTINITPSAYGDIKGIEVIEIGTIREALAYATDKNYNMETGNIEVDQKYVNTMLNISDGLCGRTAILMNITLKTYKKEIEKFIKQEINVDNLNHDSAIQESLEILEKINKIDYNETNYTDEEIITEITLKGALNQLNNSYYAMVTDSPYSAASFCFGANINLNYLAFEKNKKTLEEQTINRFLEKGFFSADDNRPPIIIDESTNGTKNNTILLKNKISDLVEKFDAEIDEKGISTIYDLQSRMIVKERLQEAREILQNANNSYSVIYAFERFNTAVEWSKMYNEETEEIVFDRESLKNSCLEKIAEVQERIQYLSVFFPLPLESVHDNILLAQDYFNNEDYELSLFAASKAKAEIDMVISLLGFGDSETKIILDEKMKLAEESIYSQESFPILAYSYYEYANSLRNTDTASALLYAEYALELSNLEVYFPKKAMGFYVDIGILRILLFGIIIGLLISSMIKPSQNPKKIYK